MLNTIPCIEWAPNCKKTNSPANTRYKVYATCIFRRSAISDPLKTKMLDPFPTQPNQRVGLRCNITLSSWTTENRRLELDFDGEDDINFLTFRESNEWMLVDSSATKDNLIYHVFEEEEPMKYTRLTYSMTIRRHFGFYVYALIVYICVYVTCTLSVYLSKVYALIIPSVLLSFLMPLTFWIPSSGDGRITLGRPACFHMHVSTLSH